MYYISVTFILHNKSSELISDEHSYLSHYTRSFGEFHTP